jgi:hypothetical protein
MANRFNGFLACPYRGDIICSKSGREAADLVPWCTTVRLLDLRAKVRHLDPEAIDLLAATKPTT